jgi:chromosome segregation ATPase
MTPKDWIAPGVIVAIMTVWLALSAGRFASIDNQYAAIAARINELDGKLDRSINRSSAADNQHGDIIKMIAGLEAKLDRSISAIAAADNQYADIAKKVTELDSKLDRSIGAIAAADNQYADIAKRVTELDDKFDRNMSGLSGRLDRVAQQQTALVGQLGEMQEELNFLKKLLESIRDKSEATPVQPAPQPPITSSGSGD